MCDLVEPKIQGGDLRNLPKHCSVHLVRAYICAKRKRKYLLELDVEIELKLSSVTV